MSLIPFQIPLKENLRSHHLSAVLQFFPAEQMITGLKLVELLTKAVLESNLCVVGSTYADFEPYGASCVLLLKESHVAVHYWPELEKITADIHVCDYSKSNLENAWKLSELITVLTGNIPNRKNWLYRLLIG
jgi:S-adenosylmethionine decarboxylase